MGWLQTVHLQRRDEHVAKRRPIVHVRVSCVGRRMHLEEDGLHRRMEARDASEERGGAGAVKPLHAHVALHRSQPVGDEGVARERRQVDARGRSSLGGGGGAPAEGRAYRLTARARSTIGRCERAVTCAEGRAVLSSAISSTESSRHLSRSRASASLHMLSSVPTGAGLADWLPVEAAADAVAFESGRKAVEMLVADVDASCKAAIAAAASSPALS
eukprot:6205451-Pleurochrysis_carterae.AAC.6